MRPEPGGRALRTARVLLAALALFVGVPGGLAAQPASATGLEVTVADAYPLRGAPVAVSVARDGRPVADAVITARYRPNSQTVHTETLPPTGADGRVTWRPKDAGVVALAVTDPAGGPALASTRVAVRFGSFPLSGLLVMVIAAVVLFGGAAWGMLILLTGPGPLPAEEPPST